MEQKQNLDKNRRDFLKGFCILAGSSLLQNTIPWFGSIERAAAQETGQLPMVKLGIIGCGGRATYLYEFIRQMESVEVVALCDDFEQHLAQMNLLTGGKAKTFTDYHKLLELNIVDAVLVTTPLHMHAPVTIDALKAGKHVFCEKSMARTLEECKAMLETHYTSGKILQIGHQRMFDIRFLKGMEWIHAGRIGNITQIRAWWHRNNNWRRNLHNPGDERRINWRLYHEYSCGLMTELASHHIQIANWALKSHPESVMGSGSLNYWKDGREVFDNVNVIYTYPHDIHFIYDSMISNKKYGMEVQVMGPLGTLEMEVGKVFLENPAPAPGIVQLINQIEKKVFDVIPVGGPSWVPENPNDDPGNYLVNKILDTDGSDIQLDAFFQSVRENKVIPGLAEQGYLAGVATLLGHQATLTKSLVKWPPEYELPVGRSGNYPPLERKHQ